MQCSWWAANLKAIEVKGAGRGKWVMTKLPYRCRCAKAPPQACRSVNLKGAGSCSSAGLRCKLGQSKGQCILCRGRQHAQAHMAKQAKAGRVAQFNAVAAQAWKIQIEVAIEVISGRAGTEEIGMAGQAEPSQTLKQGNLARFPDLERAQATRKPGLDCRLRPGL